MINLFNQPLGMFNARLQHRLPTPDEIRGLFTPEQLSSLTAEQLDDETERLTSCRFGNRHLCHSSDCRHGKR